MPTSRRAPQPAERCSVDFLILADGAQVQGDKLFMLGGGWTIVHARDFPANLTLAVAAGVLVPWLETNRRHQFSLRVRNEDAHKELASLNGEFEQGRAAGMPAGITQRVLLAVNLPLMLEGPGTFVVELAIDDTSPKRTLFQTVREGVANIQPPDQAAPPVSFAE